MWKYVVEVDGMMCGMCEAHTNDAIRHAFSVQKVTSSHKKGQTVIISEYEIDEQMLKDTLHTLGYDMGAVQKEPWEKKGLFGR